MLMFAIKETDKGLSLRHYDWQPHRSDSKNVAVASFNERKITKLAKAMERIKREN